MNKLEPSKNKIEELISVFNKKNYSETLDLIEYLLKNYPNSILVNNIAGVVQTELQNYTLAEKQFIKVVTLNPNFSDGYYNLANIYNILEKNDEAIKNYKKVIDLDKNYYKAYNNLGNIFRKKNSYKKALKYYILSLVVKPDYLRAYYNLSIILQNYNFDRENKYINKIYLYLLSKKNIVRPYSIARNVINGLYLNTEIKNYLSLIEYKDFPNNIDIIIEHFSSNELLLQFMKVCPIPSFNFEKKFTILRKEILNQIYSLKFNENYLKFIISLSSQCFLNEYIYTETKDEKEKINKIDDNIKKKIENNDEINDLEILILSCYAPLHKYDWCKKLSPSKNVLENYKIQYINFEEEKKQILSIGSISQINNKTSIKVKNQYEQNPYPRWTNLGLSIERKDIENVFKSKYLNLDVNKLNFSSKINVLIAGCGTGQHAITTASLYKNAEIYALDLSFNSLSYAKRKANELGIKNMKFIQGDLLEVKKLEKKFDLIESVGVLHHMDDPYTGWKSLTDCLNDNSLMWIGLYSKSARQHISKIRKNIYELKIRPTKKNMSNLRNEIFENNNPEMNTIKNSPDFYSSSGVRDLLFHTHEQTFTILKIRQYLKKLGLMFLGFEDRYVINKFKAEYYKSKEMYDLDKWDEFEKNNPKIFSGMYQFWCKKI